MRLSDLLLIALSTDGTKRKGTRVKKDGKKPVIIDQPTGRETPAPINQLPAGKPIDNMNGQ